MVAPRNGGAPARAVVLLHGYGADGADLIGLAGAWRDLLPDALFVAPHAPDFCADIPGGRCWFDIASEGPRLRFDAAPSAAPVIAEFLADLWAQSGLGPPQTVLGGFSQGAMMALHVGLTVEPALLGILSFSGALIPPLGFPSPGGQKPPVCLVHGDRDGIVDPALSAEAAAALRAGGHRVAYHVEVGAGHTIAPDGLAFASAFLRELVAP
jgi:phospholipase/carboxylesterase